MAALCIDCEEPGCCRGLIYAGHRSRRGAVAILIGLEAAVRKSPLAIR
jgi:hypothetical protein